MKERFQDEHIDNLFRGILSLDSIEECYEFFEDLCTVAEVRELSRRFHAAIMLSGGSTYAQIAKETGVSTATISRVKRSLRYGNDVYKSAVESLCKKENGQ